MCQSVSRAIASRYAESAYERDRQIYSTTWHDNNFSANDFISEYARKYTHIILLLHSSRMIYRKLACSRNVYRKCKNGWTRASRVASTLH